jgi:hypothetical protein
MVSFFVVVMCRVLYQKKKTIWVEVTLEDSFDSDFGIYDLNQFIGTMNNPPVIPILTFSDTEVRMNDGIFEVVYRSCAANLIKTATEDKAVVHEGSDISFDISSNLHSETHQAFTYE